jgi:isoleucyl-tRNA synthetase
MLRDSGALLHVEKMQHSYPCCWRHKSPIIFRATRSGSSAWIRKACAGAEIA